MSDVRAYWRFVAVPLEASRRVLARAETPARKPAMTRPVAWSSSTSRSQPTRDGHALPQTHRILSTSRLEASSLHGSDDHSVRAHAANSLHMPLRWSPFPPGARHGSDDTALGRVVVDHSLV